MKNLARVPNLTQSVLILPLLLQTIPSQADPLYQAFQNGTPSVDIRTRYEHVDQDNNLKEADGITFRARAGYAMAIEDFKGFVEVEHTATPLDDFNSGPGGNGKTEFSVIADPGITELNRATLQYDGLPDTVITLGRQRIKLDNVRFVGNVGWRQNEQTFDAVRLANTSLPGLKAQYIYVENQRNIFGTGLDHNTHLLNLNYSPLNGLQLGAYGYFIDFNAQAQKPASSRTLGGFIDGSHPITDTVGILYRAEYARQSDLDQGNDQIDADYRHLMAGIRVAGITLQLGREVLGDDDFSGFETPFATKHAYNGWADVFLNTPTDGLDDRYVKIGTKVAGIKLGAHYHDFQADAGDTDFGTELDLLAATKFAKHYSVGIKYAHYDADDFATDTRKFWLWTGVNF